MNAPLLPGRIEHWPLARLRPYARNAKTHSADQVTKIAASMAEFGWTVPCLVAADGELIAGHGRVLAAAQLGLAEAPVIVLDHLTEAQRRAYRIADNRLTELGGWDDVLLVEELRELMAEDFDLGLIGIPEDELDALLHDAGVDRAPIDDDTADTVPEAPEDPITKPGDIWALGGHRLICGDATDSAVVARLMEGAQASLLFTSPPYAQQRDYGAAKEKLGDWDALMQGVFGSRIGRGGWTGCVLRAGGGSAGMSGTRGRACPATGTGGWRPRTSSSSTSTASPANPTRLSRASTRAKPSAAAACAGLTARSIARRASARDDRRPRPTPARVASVPSPSTTRRRCWRGANGGQRQSQATRLPSAPSSAGSMRASITGACVASARRGPMSTR